MSLFRKNTVLLELVNKFNTMENKIDILNHKFESMTFLDGCCDCKTREVKLYNDIKDFLEDKLLNLKDTLLNSIENKDELKNIIEDVCNKHTQELHNILHKCTTLNPITKTDLLCEFKNFEDKLCTLTSVLQNFKNENTTQYNHTIKNSNENYKKSIDIYTEKDLSLRTDLQTFLVGLQTNINSNLLNNQNDIINNLTNTIKLTDTSDLLQKLHELSENTNNNVKSFYYDNEIIKHQIILEEDIQKYNDEIDNVRILAQNAKNSIQETLEKLEKELGIERVHNEHNEHNE